MCRVPCCGQKTDSMGACRNHRVDFRVKAGKGDHNGMLSPSTTSKSMEKWEQEDKNRGG